MQVLKRRRPALRHGVFQLRDGLVPVADQLNPKIRASGPDLRDRSLDGEGGHDQAARCRSTMSPGLLSSSRKSTDCRALRSRLIQALLRSNF